MPEKPSSSGGKLGTFGGVFVPNVLTILGVIMFLRTGWVVGQTGLFGAILILVLAKTLTALTTLSLSAIATNTKVGAGGAYYLVSRSLGLEIGGSVGVPLYFAQAISVAFYIVGFTESLNFIWPEANGTLIGLVALGVFTTVAWFGAELVTKTQFIIFATLIASLISFFAGVTEAFHLPEEMLQPSFTKNENFWSVFAIFFPAVTGIMAGVSMSGDLKDPSRSIPRGTLAAVAVTFVIYAAQMVWLAANSSRQDLLTNNLVMLDIAKVPWLIFAGLWAATLSSALASLAAAPRTLQALARDGIAPNALGKGAGSNREPRRALLLTAVVAAACILLGELDLIAPIITMFFLATYSTVNLVAGLESLVNNPSYRPTFKVHWFPSIAATIGCIAVMFLINPAATGLATVVILAIYYSLIRRRITTAWGDMRSGFWFAVTRLGLLRYQASKQSLRNWRPVILVLTGPARRRPRLVRLGAMLEAGRGMLFLGQVLPGNTDKMLERSDAQKESLDAYIEEEKFSAVGKTVVAEDFERGVLALLQATGVGQFEPNTVLMGWSADTLKQESFTAAVRRILQLQRNLVIYKEGSESTALNRAIDVWWYSRDNGALMVTLAHLIRTGGVRWGRHPIRVRRIISDASGEAKAHEGMARLLEDIRIEVKVEIIVSEEPPLEVIARMSQHSEVVFIGVALDGAETGTHWLDRYEPLINGLEGNLLLTKSWHDLGLREGS